MILRSGRIVENQNQLYSPFDSLPATKLSQTQSLMSQFNENMPLPPGSDHGDHGSFEPDTCRPLREYLHPPRQTTPSCIVLPVNHHRFNLKPGTIQLLPTFHGMDSENPYTHMKEFEDVCGTCMDQTVNEDVVRLKLFPFSLKDKAKMWLNTLAPRSIGTWREMQTTFLKKYFPANRTANLQRQMMNFSCKPNENFAQAWERFKDLLNACPHHAFEQLRVVSFFYDTLTPNLKMIVSTMCNSATINQ